MLFDQMFPVNRKASFQEGTTKDKQQRQTKIATDWINLGADSVKTLVKYFFHIAFSKVFHEDFYSHTYKYQSRLKPI